MSKKPNIQKDETHELWLKKFNKRKEGKMLTLLYEVKEYEANYRSYDKMTHLAGALSIATRGTKMEADSIELMKIVCPQFFNEDFN